MSTGSSNDYALANNSKEMRLTDVKTGEKPGNFQSFTKGDLIIAGRAYGTVLRQR
jgi:hypothetical protein